MFASRSRSRSSADIPLRLTSGVSDSTIELLGLNPENDAVVPKLATRANPNANERLPLFVGTGYTRPKLLRFVMRSVAFVFVPKNVASFVYPALDRPTENSKLRKEVSPAGFVKRDEKSSAMPTDVFPMAAERAPIPRLNDENRSTSSANCARRESAPRRVATVTMAMTRPRSKRLWYFMIAHSD